MTASVSCPRCRKTLDFTGDPPKFCAYCGFALAATEPPSANLADAPTLPPSPVVPSPGGPEAAPETVGGYRILRRLGGGGMGTVYEAEEPGGGRRVAVKIISADYARSADAVERFRQEGRLAGTISHPRCVFVLSADQDQGRPYIVMELMPGPTLQDLLDKKGPLPVTEAVAKALDIIEGLQEAHRLDVIHRDVKPSNCFLAEDGRVKVGDFGLSKSLTSTAQLTRTGSFMGTLVYASPEQVRGERVDKQTDVYAVAATLYCLLVGRAPFQTNDAAATLARIVTDDPPPLRDKRPDVPAVLERVVLRGLARDKTRRYQSLDELRQALLPFSAEQKADIAGLGARVVAFVVDYLLLMPVKLGLVLACLRLVTGSAADLFANPAKGARLEFLAIAAVVMLLYFTLTEGLTGASVGKRLMRLRVRTPERDEPGLRRALLRTVVFLLIWDLNPIVSRLVLTPVAAPTDPMASSLSPAMLFATVLSFVLWPVSLGFVVTMRQRNGYRGVHEWLSGTCVVPLPERAGRRDLLPRPAPRATSPPPADLPGQLGPFRVLGVLEREEGRAVLLGEDATLGRRVVLLLRSAAERPLSPARRDLTRPSRLRWIAGGTADDWQWDAFPEPTGCPLPEWVRAAGPLPWRLVRPLLEELTAELIAARDDGTLPRTLSPEQVFVDPAGRLLLLEAPLSARPAGTAWEDDDVRRFLHEVAVLALEGKPRKAGKEDGPVRAPLPPHATAALSGLVGDDRTVRHLNDVRKRLKEAGQLPDEATRPRRLAHAALLTGFLAPALLVLMGTGIASVVTAFVPTIKAEEVVASRRRLEQTAARDFFATATAPDPWARVAALGQLSADLKTLDQLDATADMTRRYAEGRRHALTPPGQAYLRQIEVVLKNMVAAREEAQTTPWSGRRVRDDAARHTVRGNLPDPRGAAVGVTWIIGVIAAFYVALAFVWRGGVAALATGLTLVRRDGRLAGRFQVAYRALLAWLPFAGLLVASFWLDAAAWDDVALESAAGLVWLSWSAWWGGWLLLLLYVALALWRPTRGPHDLLAGTYVVPR